MIPALPTAHTSTALRQIEDDAEACALKLITENAIHGRHKGVRHALELQSDVVAGELLGIEHLRLRRRRGASLDIGCGQHSGQFFAEARPGGRGRDGRGGSPGLLGGYEFESH
jgi:hypothetical protein